MFDNVAAPTLLHLKNLLGSLITSSSTSWFHVTKPSPMGYGNMLVCDVFLYWSTSLNIVKYHLHVCSQPIPVPASPDMIQMIRISGTLSEKKRTWHQNIWRYLTLLSVGIFYWWLPLSKYWTSINILEMWVEAGGWRHRVYCTGDTYTEYDNMTIWQHDKHPRQYVWTLKCS